jgi:hypothetical protein
MCALSIYVNDFRVRLNFYIFDVWEFDVLIWKPIEILIQEGQTGKINVRLGKGFKLSVPIIHSLKTKVEPFSELESIEEVKAASLKELIEPNLEDDAQFFTNEVEDEDPTDPEPLDELLKPPKPSIELKYLPSELIYAFLNNDQDSPIIISDKLSQEESLRLITVLEKHRAAFGYSLHNLKGISPILCTHRIPTDPEITPSREPQCMLNNAIREVVKKEVLKLLHAEIICPMPHSKWVSLVQVVPKKSGMTIVKNEMNELIPQ